MDSRTVVCTIAAKNYLPFARCLMDSVERHHPEYLRSVILVDRVDGYFDPEKENFEVVCSSELPIQRSRWFHFKYTILELSTAVKPYALEFLLERHQADRIIYLDPDIKIYRPLKPVVELLGRQPVVLTPHLTDPMDDDLHPGELAILQCGAYNLGFAAFAAGPVTTRLLEWWKSKLYDLCVVDVARGLFVDQRCMDLAPSLFPEVAILRHPGFNVAYWNLKQRNVRCQNGDYTAQGQPLYFFHFSGFDPENAQQFSRHQNRLRLSTLGDAAALVREYAADLFEQGYAECKTWPYAYGYFHNGARIVDTGRRLYREAPGLESHIEDPFSEEGYRMVLELSRGPAARRKSRPQVSGSDSNGTGECVQATRLARSIYESRPDLQEAFPDAFGRDGSRFLQWLLVYGKEEFHLDEAVLSPIRRQWEETTGSASLAERLRLKSGYYLLSAGLRARHTADGMTRWLHRSRASLHAAPKTMPARAPVSGGRVWITNPDGGPLELGVNLIGYMRSELSVGECAILAKKAADAAALPVALKNIGDHNPFRKPDYRSGALSSTFPYPFNLLHVNADQMEHVAGRLVGKLLRGKYNIGYWLWELDQFPDRWLNAFLPLHEVWMPSIFCQEALARKSPVPVVRIPLGISVPVQEGTGRRHFGLPEDAFLFLMIFDMLSVFERKNPMAVVEAFRRAFGGDRRYHLAIKVSNGHRRPDQMERLRLRSAGLPVTIIDSVLARSEVNALMAACDCLVSLHRSEGFGLTLAEAMYLGKPVIATGYSGNMDFTRADNALLVDYELVRVGEGAEPYPPDGVWADPSVEQAARHMRTVAEDQEVRRRIAHAGRETIRTQLSPERIGHMMRDRLWHLLDTRLAPAKSPSQTTAREAGRVAGGT